LTCSRPIAFIAAGKTGAGQVPPLTLSVTELPVSSKWCAVNPATIALSASVV
jgi:hypothetical protein